MKTLRLILFAIAISSTIANGSDSQRLEDFLKTLAPENRKQILSQAQASLELAIADFTQDIFLYLVDTVKKPNFVFSPLSLHSSLSMLYLGTTHNSTTQHEMAKAMGNVINPIMLKAGYSQAVETYNNQTDFLYGNQFWIQDGFKVKEKFKKTIKDNLNSDIDNIDFNQVESLNVVNEWISQHTRGKIQNLVKDFSSNTALFLANAMYFKEEWLVPFEDVEEDEITPVMGEFMNEQGKRQISMMHQTTSRITYGEINLPHNVTYHVLSIPYKNPLFEMQIIVPNTATNTENLEDEMRQSEERDLTKIDDKFFNLFLQPKNETQRFIEEIHFKMAPFQIHTDMDAVPPLQTLGAKAIFTNGAELEELAKGVGGFGVSKITHTALVEVSKEGTEGAAVSTGEIVLLSASFGDRLRITVDKPFIFIVQDIKNKIPVLVGRVTDPTVKIRP